MNTVLHKAESRGFANHGWLQANHSFSFANFFNPEKVHFGALRVLNDDLIAPSMGFSTHPHNNMEIITIPLKGELKHKDSVSDEWLYVRPGEVQVMSAGTGVFHSEMNASPNEHLSLFQIWIMPGEQNVKPRYDQKVFDASERKNKLQTLVSAFDSDFEQALKIHQDARLSRIELDKGQKFEYDLISGGHGVYIMVISGTVKIDENELNARDAIGVSETLQFEIDAQTESDLLLIEVPMISLN